MSNIKNITLFAIAVQELVEVSISAGVCCHYALSRDQAIAIRGELNDAVASLLERTGETYPWHSDVDVVFEAAHLALTRTLPASLAQLEPEDSASGLASAGSRP